MGNGVMGVGCTARSDVVDCGEGVGVGGMDWDGGR